MSAATLAPPDDPSTQLPALAPGNQGAILARRVRAMRWLVVPVIAMLGIDVAATGHFVWAALWIRLAWAALLAFALFGRTVRPDGRPSWRVDLVAPISALAIVLLLGVTGATASWLYPWVFVLPLIFAMVAPDRPRLMSLSSAVTCVGTALVLAACGTPMLEALLFVPQLVIVALLAHFGMGQYARLVRGEIAAAAAEAKARDELHESEARRMRSERLALVGQLAAGVAHEINNPLAYLKANLGYVREVVRESVSGDALDDLEGVFAESDTGFTRIKEIVRDLKSFARDGDETGEADVPAAIDEAIRVASVRTRGVAKVVTDTGPSLPMVRIPHRVLVQVLVNLVVNAADALEEAPAVGRHIYVRTRRREHGGLRVTVEDEGPGLPPEVLEHLFQPFFTTKGPRRGTGLGLAIACEQVTRVGGSISGENRAEGGARFEVVLPAAEATAAQVDRPIGVADA